MSFRKEIGHHRKLPCQVVGRGTRQSRMEGWCSVEGPKNVHLK